MDFLIYIVYQGTRLLHITAYEVSEDVTDISRSQMWVAASVAET
jgi:hypothetical protein